jgi:hypothetical protein
MVFMVHHLLWDMVDMYVYIYAYIARGHQILAPGTCGRKHAGNPHD